jgi:hypothetical protein
MKITLTGSLVALALLGAGSTALAQDAMMAHPKTTAMVCRPAKAGETPNAMTTAKADLVCKPIDTKMIMSMEKPIESMPKGELMWQQLLTSLDMDNDH